MKSTAESELMLCKSCHYPLKQLAKSRCPECGREFDPKDQSTFATVEDKLQPVERVGICVGLLFLGWICFYIFYWAINGPL